MKLDTNWLDKCAKAASTKKISKEYRYCSPQDLVRKIASVVDGKGIHVYGRGENEPLLYVPNGFYVREQTDTVDAPEHNYYVREQVKSLLAQQRKAAVELALADGSTPSEVEKIIKSRELGVKPTSKQNKLVLNNPPHLPISPAAIFSSILNK
ncbi:hypothetical protein JYQ62_32025 [Nostoc sp. UHCC 0702]|nr:hypothetical protein JYQ62_32025 [Nostoc sp. UHCC 0702]